MANNKRNERPPSICWDCINSVPNKSTGAGCSWSHKFKPVVGWEADYHEVSGEVRNGKRVLSGRYTVIGCPEFKRG